MKVIATHYICIKDKDKKDILILRSGDEKSLNKREQELLQKEAAGKFKIIEEKQDGKKD